MTLYRVTALFLGLLPYTYGLGVNTTIIQMGLVGERPVSDGGNISAKIGDSVFIKCEYDDYNHPKQILSLKFLPKSGGAKQVVIVPAATNSPWVDSPDHYNGEFFWELPYHLSFNITGVRLVDAGDYSCEADNHTPIVTPTSVRLDVFENTGKVEIDGVSEGRYATIGDGNEIEVICSAYNGSLPAMNLIIGDEITPFDTVEARPGVETQYEGHVLYTFKPSQDGENITCQSVVSGYEKEAVEHTAELVIHAPPQLSCPEFVTVAEGETEAEIVCNISSNTLPDVSEISWRTPAGNIGGQMELVVEGLTSSVELTEGKVSRAMLTVKVGGEKSFGPYVLEARNSGGVQSFTTQLKPKDAGPTTVEGNGSNSGSTLLLSLQSLVLSATGYMML